MTRHRNRPKIPLPRGWARSVKMAVLHVISLAQFGMAYTRGWAVNSPIARIRLKAKNERLKQAIENQAADTAVEKPVYTRASEPTWYTKYISTRLATLGLGDDVRTTILRSGSGST